MVMLEQFWVMNYPFEGASRFKALLADRERMPEQLQARALRCFAGSSWLAGDYERSHRANEESLALFRSLGDDQGVAVLLHRIGISTMYVGELADARRLLSESLELHRRVGSVRGEVEVLGGLAYLADREGDYEGARKLFERGIPMAEEIDFTWWQVNLLLGHAEALIQLERPEEAVASARLALTLARELGDRQSSLYSVAVVAWSTALGGDGERAGLLWGAVEAEAARAPVGQWETESELYAGRVLVGDREELERGRHKGRLLSFESAVDEALD
jgi:tetratricopeptide (TPR) repeat protein